MSKVSGCVAVAASSALLFVACAPDDGPRAYVLAMGTQGNGSSVTITGDQVAFDALGGDLKFGLRTSRMGRGGTEMEMPHVGASRLEGNVVVLDRGTMEERYEARPEGLEQTWRVDAPFDGAGELEIEVRFEGVTPSIRSSGVVALRDVEGRSRAMYRDLAVIDAKGYTMPSRMDVVGSRVRLTIDDRSAVYPVEVDPLIAVQEAELFAGDGAQGDDFGLGTGISGDTVVVGASRHGGRGAAFVFVRSGTAWIQQAELAASGSTGFEFGAALSIFGDTVVVGDPADAQFTGAAYVFVRSGSTWSEQAKLTCPTGYDGCGQAVGVFGDTVLAGQGPGPTRGCRPYASVGRYPPCGEPHAKTESPTGFRLDET